MHPLNVGIVEDEMIVAEDMKDMLELMGYRVGFIAGSAAEARTFLNVSAPDIILIDIRIKGVETGTDLAKFVADNFEIPFIYVTSNTDKATIESAKDTFPFGFVPKPFDSKDLFAAIEIAMANFGKQHSEKSKIDDDNAFVAKDSIFVRDHKFFIKVRFSDIEYLEADANYTSIYTLARKITLRSTLKEIEHRLPPEQFIRIHKSYIIRLDALTGINAQWVLIGKKELPIGRKYHDLINSRLNRLSS